MFSTPFTCCSIGAPIVSATVCAFAPGYDAVTLTVGGTMSGYCEMGSDVSAIAPTIVMTMDSTDAKIGRSINTWLIFTARYFFSVSGATVATSAAGIGLGSTSM